MYFPRLTETFVAEEIRFIRLHGIDARIISILEPKSEPAQPLSKQLLPQTWYAPRSLSLAIWRAQLHYIHKSPRLYLSLLATLLCQPYPRKPLQLFLKRLVVFLKAVSVAHHLQGSGVQLLHTHFAWLSGAATWICARLLDKPFTVTLHAYDIYSHKNDLLPLVSREATHLITISNFNRLHLAELGTCPVEAISLIHCGVDLAKFRNHQHNKEEPPICDPLRILSVGSLVAMKGHRYLIKACHLLAEKGLDFTCTIIGSGPDESVLRKQIRAYGLQDKVKLLGAQLHPEVIASYYQHGLFVLASIVEPDGNRDGIPVALMEAGTVGLAIISTSVSGIPELIRHNQTGWLVPPNDAVALADAIAILAANPTMRSQMGQNARSLVEAQFNIENNTKEIAALFENIYQQWKHNYD
jgi:colanic acid/amylovoran biosynthesis glycosyltransferase